MSESRLIEVITTGRLTCVYSKYKATVKRLFRLNNKFQKLLYMNKTKSLLLKDSKRLEDVDALSTENCQ